MSQTLGEAIVGLRATLVAAMQSSDDAALDRAVELSDQVVVHPSFAASTRRWRRWCGLWVDLPAFSGTGSQIDPWT